MPRRGRCFDRADGVICVPLAPTVNKPLQAQLRRRQRRRWHRYLALERPLSRPKGAAYRHNHDVDLQSADSIKFVFSGAAIPSARRHAAGHRTSDGTPIQRGRRRRSGPPTFISTTRFRPAQAARHSIEHFVLAGRPCNPSLRFSRHWRRGGCSTWGACWQRRPQIHANESATRLIACRFNARMTPRRAIRVGPWRR